MPDPVTDADKVNWEVLKLRAEVDNLRRPWLMQPASWISLVTAMLAVGGIFLQYNRSVIDSQLAEAKKIAAENQENEAQKKAGEAEHALKLAKDARDKINEEQARLMVNVKQLKLELDNYGVLLATAKRPEATLIQTQVLTFASEKRNEEKNKNLTGLQTTRKELGKRIDSLAASFAPESMVAPSRVPVYIQIAHERQRQAATNIQTALHEQGFDVRGIENMEHKANMPPVTEVRYFKYPELLVPAGNIAAILKKTGVNTDQPRYTRPDRGADTNSLEIWFDDKFAGAQRPGASH